MLSSQETIERIHRDTIMGTPITTSGAHQSNSGLAAFKIRARRKRWASAAGARRGVSVVEFALVAPVLFLLLFGIVEFARLMMVRQAMTNAAREAGRKASLATTLNATSVDSAARNFMSRVMANASDTSKVRVNITPASMVGVPSGTPVTVAIDVNFADISWLPGSLLDLAGSRVLRAEATFDRE
jgi:Flp pilus assembly protein TadG